MAFLGKTYDFTDAPEPSFDPIPTGWYRARVSDSRLKDTRAGDGKYLEVEFTVLGPSYEGRRAWGRFNLENPSDKAVEIGRAQLGELCRAVGKVQITNSDELHGEDLQIRVVVTPERDGYDASNDVKRYKPIEGGMSASLGTANASSKAAFAAPQKAAPVAPTGAKGATPPWASKGA